MELSIDRLTKQYQNKIAVDRISLRLNTGIYGLLGANGAGKTMYVPVCIKEKLLPIQHRGTRQARIIKSSTPKILILASTTLFKEKRVDNSKSLKWLKQELRKEGFNR